MCRTTFNPNANTTLLQVAIHVDTREQGCSGAGTRWNAVPANILEPKRHSGKYHWPQVER